MPSRSLLLLDADTIIHMHEMALWGGVISQNKVAIASTVIHTEVFHYKTPDGNKVPINLELEVQDRKITELSAEISEIQAIDKKFCKPSDPALDPGELEGIAILNKMRDADIEFCTCDGAAIKALAMLRLDDKAISYEEVINRSGIRSARILPEHSSLRFKALVTEARYSLL